MSSVDLTLQKRQPVVFVPYGRIAASGTSDVISGFLNANTVTLQVSAQSTNAIAAGTITVRFEHSDDDGSTWSTLHVFGPFQPGSHDEEVTVTGVNDTLRVTWTVTGTAAWRMNVTAVANASFIAGSGGGAGGATGPAGGALSGNYPNPSLAANAVTTTKIADAAVTDGKVAAANKDGIAAVPSLRTLGTGPQQAVAGNDSRLSNSRRGAATKTAETL